MAIVIAYGVAATIATILQCVPIARAWDKTISGTCFDITAFWYANASYTIATDLILLVLPVRVIWGLKLRAIQKAAVLMMFAMGGLVTIFSIIRMTTLVASAISNDPTCEFTGFNFLSIIAACRGEKSWLMFFPELDVIESTSWANIETNVAILCACLPIFRRPLAMVFPRLFSALGDYPTPALGTEDHTSWHIEADRSQWAIDCSKRGGAPHDTTKLRERNASATRNGGSDEFVLEHVEDTKVALY